jgi:hypothetical protein
MEMINIYFCSFFKYLASQAGGGFIRNLSKNSLVIPICIQNVINFESDLC